MQTDTPQRHDPTGLAGAWMNRVKKAEAILAVAVTAPALFKPEHIAQTLAEHSAASGWVRYWLGIGGTR